MKYKVWSSTEEHNERLNEAYNDTKKNNFPLYLLFRYIYIYIYNVV